MSEWQPISTAPKNTPVLLLTKARGHEICYFSWEEGFQGSWRYASGHVRGQWAGWDFTHWMHLPASPTTDRSDSDG